MVVSLTWVTFSIDAEIVDPSTDAELLDSLTDTELFDSSIEVVVAMKRPLASLCLIQLSLMRLAFSELFNSGM